MSVRDDLLSQMADRVLSAGLGELALRPLAAAVGTNARMLIYHFRSKEALVQELLEECRRRRTDAFGACPTESFSSTWAFLSSKRMEQHARLAIEVEALVAQGRKEFVKEARRINAEWISLFSSRGRKASAAAAACRGLLLDLFSSGDRTRVNAAAHELALLIDQRTRA